MSAERDRRSAYRVQTSGARDLLALLETAGGEFRGEIRNLSIGGAGLRFALDEAPCLALGTSVRLTISLPLVTEACEFRARVCHRTERRDCRDYGMAFEPQSARERRRSEAFYRLFNRRRAYRVTPDPAQPLPVSAVGSARTQVLSEVNDISALGLSFFTDREGDARLTLDDRVTLRLSLDGGEPLVLASVIRGRILDGTDRVRYSVAFDRADPSFAEAEERLADYVMVLQREELQRNASLRGG